MSENIRNKFMSLVEELNNSTIRVQEGIVDLKGFNAIYGTYIMLNIKGEHGDLPATVRSQAGFNPLVSAFDSEKEDLKQDGTETPPDSKGFVAISSRDIKQDKLKAEIPGTILWQRPTKFSFNGPANAVVGVYK